MEFPPDILMGEPIMKKVKVLKINLRKIEPSQFSYPS